MPEPAEQLRAAAQRLRELAGAATPGPWTYVPSSRGGWYVDPQTVASVGRKVEAAYIAAMHPGVAQALAELLDAVAKDIADNVTLPGYAWAKAETLARLVLEAK